ncbi:auxin-responsive protein IAA26 isoform X2 [Abrus precatorius]|uniref:Auxin-induced protein n=1 Tax=Abrus precatorius TaxID=3816 RepID=A0A8B8KE29_ABRPR|nr:auxin-responsive protein IAA26 isoform X2 [Abrus precatorius]
MDERSRNEVSPQLLDLISNEREWHKSREEGKCSEERKLELRLGPPGGEDWSHSGKMKNSNTEREESLLSLELQNGDNKVFSPSSANTAVSQPNTSQKRTAPAPVVGWPPIRSFRKNLASSSSASKAPPESQHEQHNKVAGKKPVDNYGKGLFVKINMDGVPIGRKVDLNAYDSYESLSSAVDELFRGLLAAQRDSSAGGVHNKEEEKAITGLLDGSGEYTLVYEDNEGDRMLVGDVPWQMFVSTVKRLRVLKSSELSAFTLGSKQEKMSLGSTMN